MDNVLGWVFVIGWFVAILGGAAWEFLTSPFERGYGYDGEWLDRVLGRIKVGGETMTGKRVGPNDFLIAVRNDDLNPPHEVVRTRQCRKCQHIILPLSGCKCVLSGGKIPEFVTATPGSFAHQHLA